MPPSCFHSEAAWNTMVYCMLSPRWLNVDVYADIEHSKPQHTRNSSVVAATRKMLWQCLRCRGWFKRKEGGGSLWTLLLHACQILNNVKGIAFVSVSFFCLYSYCSISIFKHYSHKWCCSWQDTLLLKSLTKSTNHQNKIRDRSVVGNDSISVVLVKRLHFWFSYSWFLDSENNFGLVQFESPVLTVALVSYSFNY